MRKQLAEAKRIVREPKYETERYCCTVCAKKKKCHVCGAVTEYACSDCAIDLRMAVYVCATTECRHAHEEKCPATLRARIETLTKYVQHSRGCEIHLCSACDEHPESAHVDGCHAYGSMDQCECPGFVAKPCTCGLAAALGKEKP